MRILSADKATVSLLSGLEGLGHVCHVRAELTADELPSAIAGYEILIVRSTVVSAATIEAADRLRLIIRAGAGTNTIDTQAAARRAVYVCNVPGKNAIAVAELTLGLILSLDRNIPDNVEELKRGMWDKTRFGRAAGLAGRHLGIVGLGQIGMAVAERARAFGMMIHVIGKTERSPATSRRLAEWQVVVEPDLTTLAAACDIVSFHLPAAQATKGIIGRELLAAVRPGAIIINTARGDLIDERAVLEAIKDKGIRLGLDVFPDEPAEGKTPFVSALGQSPNVYGTHHIGASTEQAQEAIAAEVIRIVEEFERGNLIHCVNLEAQALGTATLFVRHHDEVGVLSELLALLKTAGINVEQMENRIFRGAEAAEAIIHIQGEIADDLLARLAAVNHVIGVSMAANR